MTTARFPVQRGRGRPKSDNRFCSSCGEPLVVGDNARETRKGSGRARSKCKTCENKGRYKRRYPKPATLVFDIPVVSEIHAARAAVNLPRIERITLKISCSWSPRHARAIWFERLNPAGMTVQEFHSFTSSAPWKGGLSRKKTNSYYQDLVCDECGARVRYDHHLERVCEACGLVHGEAVTFTDSDLRGWQGVKLSEWRSKHGPRIWWGRDGEHDWRDSEGEDAPTARDVYYSRTRAGEAVGVGRLKLERLLATGQPLRRGRSRR